jgi:PQQ-dependent dehydrogenase (methanol/ethanol family)
VRVLYAILVITTIACSPRTQGQSASSPAEAQFAHLCAGCHGEHAMGGDRAPALVNNQDLRTRTETQVHDLIKNGLPGGMPAFDLPEQQLRSLAVWVKSLNAPASATAPAGDPMAGQLFFFGKGGCATCHMVHGRGTSNGPDLSDVGLKRNQHEIELVLDNPTSQMGMHTTASCPGFAFCPDFSWAIVVVRMRDGSSLRGFARHRSEHALQLQDFDGCMHLLRDSEYVTITQEKESYMPPLQATAEERRNLLGYLSRLSGTTTGPLKTETAPVSSDNIKAITFPKPGDWPNYNGVQGGNRFSRLAQIDVQNVHTLQPQWIYALRGSGLQTTPLVSDGVMYVTAPGKVCAIDGGTGGEIWCYTQSAQNGEPNRGVALLDDRIFFATSGAHLICLNRLTGGVMWDVKMPSTPGPYSATGAPLVVGHLVISGISGGDLPLRGFIAAYDATTGEEAWRFWTVPQAGDAAAETWSASALATGGGATWLTGSYDVETDTLYWAVGNPFPATDGDARGGPNLYTDCVLALNPKDGKLKWHYQFTPHDLHDWDAAEPLLVVDAEYQGHARKLLLQANRNGFFYVLDRTNGELLLGRPFVKKLNWASGIGPDGMPQLLPANQPTKAGVKTCPAVRGATNWYSSSFNPKTRLFYVMAVEDCSVYKIAHAGGYEGYRDPADPGKKYLRALDIATGKNVWEIPQVGAPEINYSGVLSTAGGLVFYGESGGNFAAVDAKTGKTLWNFTANDPWKASPITYMIKGRQYVAIASGGNVLSFSLPEQGQFSTH